MFGPLDTGVGHYIVLGNESGDRLTGLDGRNGARSKFSAWTGRPVLLTTETETFAGFASTY